jgi:hypothetical protein
MWTFFLFSDSRSVEIQSCDFRMKNAALKMLVKLTLGV